MEFNSSDILVLQSVFNCEGRDGSAASLAGIISYADYIDHSVMTYDEFANGVQKLMAIRLVMQRGKKFATTKRFKDWWSEKFKDKKRVYADKERIEFKAYLNEVFGKTDAIKSKTVLKLDAETFDLEVKAYLARMNV